MQILLTIEIGLLMMNRLLQPWLVYTELALSVLLILCGFGMRAWGGGPGSPKAGLFVVWVGVGCLVLWLVLWTAMLHRRSRRNAAQ